MYFLLYLFLVVFSMSAFADDEKLKAEDYITYDATVPKELVIMSLRPSAFVIMGDKGMIVTIHLDDGHVEFGEGYGNNDETAKEFWERIGLYWRQHYKPIEGR